MRIQKSPDTCGRGLNDHKISAADGFRELCVTFKKLLVMKYFSVTPHLKFSVVFFHPFQATSKTEIRNFLATIKILKLQNAASPIKSRFFNYCRKEENGTDNSSLPGLSDFPTFDWDQLVNYDPSTRIKRTPSN